MPLGADKASNKKWGLRRLSLTKSNFSKQSSIDSSGAPAQVANNEKILVPSSPKEKEALNGTGEQIENVPPDIKDSRDQWSDDEEEECKCIQAIFEFLFSFHKVPSSFCWPCL